MITVFDLQRHTTYKMTAFFKGPLQVTQDVTAECNSKDCFIFLFFKAIPGNAYLFHQCRTWGILLL